MNRTRFPAAERANVVDEEGFKILVRISKFLPYRGHDFSFVSERANCPQCGCETHYNQFFNTRKHETARDFGMFE